MKTAIIVIGFFAVSLAAMVKRQAPPAPAPIPSPAATAPASASAPAHQLPSVYTLPDGAELVVGPIQSTFTCDQKNYGYYADPANACKIFHVCVPDVNADGTPSGSSALYSFFCGNQTVFDQPNLTCSHPADATPCDQSPNFYNVNDNFGKTAAPK